MIRFFIISAVFLICPSLRGQYGYFNIYFEQDPPNFGSSSRNIFVLSDGYQCIGNTATFEGEFYIARKLDFTGNLQFDADYSFPTSRSLGNPDTYIQLQSGEYFILETNTRPIGYTAAIAHWTEDFEYLYTDTLAYTNEDTAAYNMRAICLVDDTSFVICGTQLFNDNPGEFPDVVDRSEKVLWKYHIDGHVIWKQVLFEEEETGFFANSIYELDNNQILISINEYVNDHTNFQIIKTDPDGEVLSTYNWGNPDEPEGRCKSVMLDNGHLMIFYHYQNASSEVILQDIELHFMEFDPETMLPVPGTDTEVPNDFTDEWIAHFAPEDLIATPDGGYLALMNFDFIENGPYGDQPLLLKVDSALQLEWMRAYMPPVESIEGYLLDIENTNDGGYVATGWFTMANTLYQRHWVIKLDACGEVEDNGCPFVGLEEGEDANIQVKVYPNPAMDFLTLQSTQEISALKIFNVSGKLIFQKQMEGHTTEERLDISDFSSGVYIVEIMHSDKSFSVTYFTHE